MRFHGNPSATVLVVDYNRPASIKGSTDESNAGNPEFFDEKTGCMLGYRWLGLKPNVFNDPNKVAVLSISECCTTNDQGRKTNGKETCYEELHKEIKRNLPNLKLIIPIGEIAIRNVLKKKATVNDKMNATEIVEAHKCFQLEYFPMIHPWERSVENFKNKFKDFQSICSALRDAVSNALQTQSQRTTLFGALRQFFCRIFCKNC